MQQEQNPLITGDVEKSIIDRLKKVSSIGGQDVKDAGRSVALYIAGMSEQKVKGHIKLKTFSGANALEHISNPYTPRAREAWYRGKAICKAAGLPMPRCNWEDRPGQDI